MRNALFLAGIWVGIIVVAYGVVYWGGGPTEIPYLPDVPFTETVYADPAGRFELTLPAGWIVSDEVMFAAVAGPEREITGGVVVIVEEDPEAAVAVAWTMIAPNAVPQPEIVTAGPALEPSAPTWHVTYAVPEDRSAIAEAYQDSGVVTVLILQGPAESMARRALDIDRVELVVFDALTVPGDPSESAGPDGATDAVLPDAGVDSPPAEVQTPSEIVDGAALPQIP